MKQRNVRRRLCLHPVYFGRHFTSCDLHDERIRGGHTERKVNTTSFLLRSINSTTPPFAVCVPAALFQRERGSAVPPFCRPSRRRQVES